MEGASCITRSIIDELHSLDVQRNEIEGERCDTPSCIDELHSLDILRV